MLDYLDLEADLPPDDLAWRDAAREFVDEVVAPDIASHYRTGTFPEEWIRGMGARGFFAPTLAAGSDPAGAATRPASDRAAGLVLQELEAGDSGVRSMASVQGSLVMYPIHRFGSADQRQRWLAALATGEAVGAFALTEPDHGSNPAGMETTAERRGDTYVLSGEKRWSTNAPIADVILVWARDQSVDGNPVRGFLVDPEWPGVDVHEIRGKLSLRASVSGELALDDVEVPADSVLPGVEGMRGPLSCLTQARYGIVWGTVGASRDCFETARTYALEREQFGRPIAGFQLQQEKLAEMATRVTTGQLLAHRLAALKEAGDLRPAQVSMGKRENARMAREVARTARELLGGNGILDDYSPMRHLANLETVYTYEGTHDIHSLVIGEDLTDLAAFDN